MIITIFNALGLDAPLIRFMTMSGREMSREDQYTMRRAAFQKPQQKNPSKIRTVHHRANKKRFT